jgi:hypothetical protein
MNKVTIDLSRLIINKKEIKFPEDFSKEINLPEKKLKT